MLDTATASAQRGAELVKQILAFARGVGGDLKVLQVRHLEEIIKLVRDNLPRSIQIQTSIAGNLNRIQNEKVKKCPEKLSVPAIVEFDPWRGWLAWRASFASTTRKGCKGCRQDQRLLSGIAVIGPATLWKSLSTEVRVSLQDHNCRSSERYWIASEMCSDVSRSDPVRSATVRATFKMRS